MSAYMQGETTRLIWWCKNSALIAAGLVLASQLAVSVAAPALECPQSIPEQSVRLVDAPKGWNTFVRAPLYLNSAAPMAGPPEHLGELADYEQKKVRGGWKNTYQLDGKFPEGKWLACGYGESNQVVLSMRLDDNVQSCVITYSKGSHLGEIKVAVTCR